MKRMNRKLAILILVAVAVVATAQSWAATNQELNDLGYYSVKQSGAVGDGVADDTDEINAAIRYAWKNQLVVFFPSGTYKVSDTIECYYPGSKVVKDDGKIVYVCDTHDTPIQLVGSTAGARPTIKLANTSSGFGSINYSSPNPKPVIEVMMFGDNDGDGILDGTEPINVGEANLFSTGLRNLNIEIGSGNPGAAALDFEGSQACFLMDISINMTSGFCGLYKLLGQQATAGNIEITGGYCGIYAPTGRYPSLVGLQLINQTGYAIYGYNAMGMGITGFKIQKADAPAVKMFSSTAINSGHISFLDGTIEFTSANGDPAIDNETAGKTVVMKNVYVKNASAIVDSKNKPSVPGNDSGWKKVDEYVYPAADSGINAINGSTNTNEYITASNCTFDDVPTDLISRHLWDEDDWPTGDVILDRSKTDSDYAVVPSSWKDTYVNDDGQTVPSPVDYTIDNSGTDRADQIQSLLDNHKVILLPKGKFLVGKPLTLRASNTLIGVSHSFAGFYTIDTWKPTEAQYNAWDGSTSVIRTVDSATAACKMGHIQIRHATYLNREWHTNWDWRAGKQSMTRDNFTRPMRQDTNEGGQPVAGFRFYGNAGGRHYGFGLGPDIDSYNVGCLRIYVKGTTQPLLLYNTNAESAHSTYQAKAQDCQNLALYGTKGEETPGWLFDNADNCAYFAASANGSTQVGLSGDSGSNCDDVYFANHNFKRQTDKDGSVYTAMMFREYWNGAKTVDINNHHSIGVVKRGTCDFSDLVISDPGTGDTTPPSTPTGLSATADNGNFEIDLDWSDNSEPDLDGYHVYRSTASDGSYYRLTSSPVTASAYSDSDTVIRDGATYYYKVSAVDTSDNESDLSTADSEALNDTMAPPVPTNLSPQPGNAQVTLDWDDSTAGDFSQFKIYRSTTSGSYGAALATVTVSSYVDASVTNDTTYYYTVSAVDSLSNESAKSSEVSATPVEGGQLTATFDPTDDAPVYQNDPTNNYGTWYKLRVRAGDTSKEAQTFFKFNVTGVGTIISAKLKVKSLSDVVPPFDVDAHAVSDTTWDEDTVTWNSKPTLGSQIDTETVTDTSTWYDLDVSSHITGTGTYSIGLSSDSDGSLNQHLYSKESENLADRPKLEIVYYGTDSTPPAAPTGLTATAGDQQVTLDWNDNSENDLSHYEVYRSTTSGSYGTAIATPTASTLTDQNLENGTTYYYVVMAVDDNANKSLASSEVSAEPKDITPPNAPSGLDVTGGDSFVSLDWSDNTESDLEGYNVYRSSSSTVFTDQIASLIDASEFVDESVVNDETYYYAVAAQDTSGNESALTVSSSVTPHDSTAPSAPTGLTATADDRQIQLTWNDNTESDLAGYKVLRSTVSGGPYTQVATVTQPTYLDTGLTNGTTYYYVVSAFDEVPNYSANSVEDSDTPADVTAPAAPTGLSATAGDTQIVLDWADNSEDDLVDYKVYRSTTSNSYGAAIATVTSSGYTDTGLTNGTTYYYKVTARDEVPNESAMSTEASEVPADTLAPVAPTGLVVTAGDTEVELVWSANSESDLTDYRVYRSTTSGSYGSAIATVTSPTYTDTGLTNGTTYFYVVTARDEVPNESTASAEASATPQGTGGGGGSTNFTPTDDVFCRSDSATSNYNSQPYIRMKDTTVDYYGFTKFSVVDISGTIESVVLHVKSTSDSATGGTLNAMAVSNTSWTESTLTWNNKPAYGSTIDTVTVAATSTWYELDVTSYVTGNGTFSIGLYVSNTKDTRVHSKEATSEADRPYLVVTTAGGDDTTAPATPSGLGATAGDTQVTLNWNDNSEQDFDHYNVKRSTTSGSGYTLIATRSTSDYVDIGRTNGTTYYYVVSAVDEVGNESANCTQESATPADVTAPTSPQGLTATPGDGQVVLNWPDNTDADLTDYLVYRSTTSGSYYSALATVTVSQYTDEAVTNGVTYYYRVTARDEVANESAMSAEVSAQPFITGDPVAFAPVADAPVYQNDASTNYGTWYKLRVRSSATSKEAISFFKFTVADTSAIQSAKLKFKSLSDSAVPFPCSVQAVSDTTWAESGITYNNKPSLGAVLDTVQVIATGTWYEVDVSDYITGNGTYSLALTSSSDVFGQHISSREDEIVGNRPYLEITQGAGSSFRAEKGSVSNVGSASWTQVTLSNTYVSPVVVCTTNYTSSDVPMIVRVRNASGNHFDVQVVNPSGTSVSGRTVQYMVVEEGVYSEGTDGVKMEAKKVTSTVTDGYTNGWWGQTISTTNSYSTPVVLGQVMSANDASWSQFWCCSEADYTQPPNNGAFALGKHVGEDTDLTRSNETLGYIVIEAGAGTMGTMDYLAGRSDDIVRGMDNAPPFAVSLSGLSSASNAIVTQNAMEGDNGGWAVGYGTSWFSSTNLNLACDEDQITDTERLHATEPVAYLVFE